MVRSWYRDTPVHEIYAKLGCCKSHALPLFQAVSGCNTTLQMLGCGNKTAWSVWKAMPSITNTYLSLLSDPASLTIDSDHMKELERFTVVSSYVQ